MSKLIRIPYTSMPEINTITQDYQVRYRLRSEDGSRLSAWSPIYSISPKFLYIQGDFSKPGTLIMQKQSPAPGKAYVSLIWDSVSIYKDINTSIGRIDKYDFWLQYTEVGGANPSDWIYRERVSTTSMNENVPTTYTDSTGNTTRVPKLMNAEIYAPATPILRYSDKTVSITQNVTYVNTSTDTVITTSAHGLETGDAVIYISSNPIGGITNDSAYWINVSTSTSFSLYNSRSEAILNINKVNLTSTGSGTGTFSRYPFLLYKGIVTNL